MSASRTPAVADAVVVTAGTKAADAVAAAGLPVHGPKAIVVVRTAEGTLKDLDWAPDTDTTVTPVSGSRRSIQSMSSGPFAPTWNTVSPRRATVRSLRRPPDSSSIRV